MSVYRDPRSPFYYCDFEVGGHRHKRSTKKRSKREAEAVERALRERALAELRAEAQPASRYTLAEGCARYLDEISEGGEVDREIERQLARDLSFLSADKPMRDLTGDDVAKLVNWLRGRRKWDRADMPLLSAATVNRTGVELLRRVYTRARKQWGAVFPHKPHWTRYRLDEPDDRTRELHGGEREALELAMRDDYAPALAFALATGFRLNEIATLKWSEVNWEAGKIKKLGKGKHIVRTDITPAVEAILAPLVGHHPDAVFTYRAVRTTRKGRVKGRRYPITREGLKTAWRRARARSGVKGFRWHDTRHDFGTRVQRACRNIKVTMRAMNHAQIASTVRYLHVTDDEVTTALEAAQNPTTAKREAS